MPMFPVVPGEESAAKETRVFDEAENLREVGSILEGFELRFRKRVVVARIRPAVGLGDSEVAQQERNGSGSHGRTPIRVQS